MNELDINSLTKSELLELQEEMEDKKEDEMEDDLDARSEMQEDYGSPAMEEKQNQHSFLHKAAFESSDTVRTTFLHEGELGKPLFTVRFMMDMEDVAHYYLDPLLKSYSLNPKFYNRIALYFREKNHNVTDSGMSNKGFAMNLNVTQKKDLTRKKLRVGNQDNLKGGDK